MSELGGSSTSTHCEMQNLLTSHGIVAHAECYQNAIDLKFYRQLVLIYAVLEAGRPKIKGEGAQHLVRASFLVYKQCLLCPR